MKNGDANENIFTKKMFKKTKQKTRYQIYVYFIKISFTYIYYKNKTYT